MHYHTNWLTMLKVREENRKAKANEVKEVKVKPSMK
jgi:hypothetical protein